MKSKVPYFAIVVLAAIATPICSSAADIDGILDVLGEYSPKGAEAQGQLASMSSSDFRELVIRGLKRENPRTREAVVRAVGDKKAADLLPLLVEAGRRETAWRVKDEVMLVSKDLEGDVAADFLRSEAQDPDPTVQSLAIRYLANMGFKEDSPLFQAKLLNDAPIVQLAAGRALVRRGIKVDRSISLRYIDVATATYRASAIELLGETGVPADIEHLNRIIQDTLGKRHFQFDVLIATTAIQMRSLPPNDQAGFLKENLSRSPILRDWAAFRLLEVPGGINVLRQVAVQTGHPAHDVVSRALGVSATPQWTRLHSK